MFLIRHGESLANQEKLIVSDPNHGVDGYGLTSKGREQVQRSLEGSDWDPNSIDAIVSSDFRRARETAEIIATAFGLTILFDENLRERGFGDFELTTNLNYDLVWQEDQLNPSHHKWGVESVQEVANRMQRVVDRYVGENRGILLVSHGDPLQILQTLRSGRPISEHRNMPAIRTAQILPLYPITPK